MLSTLLLTLAWSCKDDDMGSRNFYSSCCETPGVDISIGQGNVFIPNIYTPNADGVNDVFVIFADQEIAEIQLLTIQNSNGINVFSLSNFPPNDFGFIWAPADANEAPNGLYSYSADIQSSDGVVENVRGSVCVYRCKTDTDSILTENISNCHFPTQHDGQGGHDPLAPSIENSNCF